MLDEKDLQAIQNLLSAMEQRTDAKLEAMEQRTDEKLNGLEQKLDEKLARQKDELLDEATHRMRVLLDAEIKPQFNLLAEGQQEIRDMLVPRSRVDDLEDEVKFLKTVVRQISEEVQKLKKAQ